VTAPAEAPRRILIAFDKFKGALSAAAACEVAAEVLRRRRPSWQLDCAPLSDGGDGFCRILSDAAHGSFERVAASGPLFDATGSAPRVSAEIGRVELARLPLAARQRLASGASARARLAIVEMASVNGLSLIAEPQRDVWRASSYGTGELLLAASRLPVAAVLLGVGGSATSDLGLGALCALGLRFEDAAGVELRPPIPALWSRIQRVGGAVSSELPPILIACDVNNPLLGPRGAAAVYGPQKGLKPEDLPGHEREAARLARLVCQALDVDMALSDTPGAGAAGGIAFGLLAAARARLLPGFELVSDWLDLDARLAQAAIVITGEGRFDASSWAGKGPGAIVEKARRLRVPSVIFAGAVSAAPQASDFSAIAISPPDMPIAQALAGTPEQLARAVERWLDGIDSSRVS
jgi:glycerate 2-kinase